jgi:effector-binding domain-containing protein
LKKRLSNIMAKQLIICKMPFNKALLYQVSFRHLVLHLKYITIIFCTFVFAACNNQETNAFKEKVKADYAAKKTEDEKIVPKKFEEFNDNPGPAGIFEMPEMLTLCVHDSASLGNMPIAFARAYRILDEEVKTLKLKQNGAPGSIYFSTDPKKIIFECVYPIEKMPEVQPQKSMVVVLEACHMYIYNYYGPYGDLYLAYDDIRKNLKKNKLGQNGPMREFYITDPNAVKDSTRWLTRIMTPVGRAKK